MENSFLGRLPAELRTLVYEYVLYEPQGADIWTEPGLLRTSSTIRAEAELMYYSLNMFKTTIHEDYMNHDLCQWLRQKAGLRISLIRGLEIHAELPSINASAQGDSEDEIYDRHDTADLSFFQLMHTVETIQKTTFGGRSVEDVVSWTLNGACDAKTFDSIDQMSVADQDRYRGAKFLLLYMVYGKAETVDALHEDQVVQRLTELDEAVQRSRAASRA